jgi:acyl-CoA synthetase (AMP-forming)/AMP-acid ligase II
MTNPAIKDFLALLAANAAHKPGRTVLSELTEQGWVGTGAAEFLVSVERAARHAARLAGPVTVVLDGSTASVAALLGLLAAGSVDVLAIEQDNSHLTDPQSAIWDVGTRVLVVRDDGTGHTGRSMPTLTYSHLLAPEDGEASGLRMPQASGQTTASPAVLLLTSGSAGEPRIARQPLESVLRGGGLYRQVHGYRRSDRIMLPIPIAHSFGLVGGLLAGLGSGAELLTMPKFSLSGLLSGLNDGASVLLGSPLLYTMLARAWGTSFRAPQLRLMLSSGGPLAADIAAEMRRCAGVAVRQVYGSTESGLIACQDGSGRDWHPGSVGTFAPGVEWELIPSAASACGPGGVTEQGRHLAVRTSTMFTGYTSGAGLRPDGYYETGDLVEVTESGEVFLMGRKSTFINVGGKKTNPRRVERIILQYPEISEVHVFGVTIHHEQAVQAVVVPAPGSGGLQLHELAEFCRSKLAAHEVPHRFCVLPKLPRTWLGQIDQSSLLAAITGEGQPSA